MYKDFEKIFTMLCQKQFKSQASAPFSMLFAVKIAVRDLCGEAVCAQTGAGWRWRNLEWIRSQAFVSLSQKQNRKPLRRSPFRQLIRRGSNSAKRERFCRLFYKRRSVNPPKGGDTKPNGSKVEGLGQPVAVGRCRCICGGVFLPRILQPVWICFRAGVSCILDKRTFEGNDPWHSCGVNTEAVIT